MAAAGIRTTRAALFTALCVTLSTGAHVLLSRSPVPLATLLAVSAAVFVVAFVFADRERGYGRIAALLIPLELFADTVFTSGQHACYGHSGGPVTGPLRTVGIDMVCAGGDVGTPLTQLAPGGSPLAAAAHGGSPWLLLTAHVAVGLVGAAWLWRGEAALARLLRAAAVSAFRPLLLAVGVHRPAHPAPSPLPRTAAAPAVPALPLLSHSVLRRGPPCALAIAA